MNALISLKDGSLVDVQLDAHLANGDINFAVGPDRAWLEFTSTDAHGRAMVEAAALWLIDTDEAVNALARGLGAPIPAKGATSTSGWRVTWIVGGQIAKRAAVTFDQAIFLIEALAAHNLLDYETHLFRA